MFDPMKTVVTGQDWPPPGDSARISAYEDARNVVDGNHIVAFKDQADQARYGVYITCNLAGLIVRRSTDLLFGEEIGLQFEDGATEDKVEALNDFWYDADVQKTLYEGAIDGASLGDAVFLPVKRDDKVYIEPAQVQTWFPVLDPDNVRIVYQHIFSWPRVWIGPRGEKIDFLKMRLHNKGWIDNQLWEYKSGKLYKQHFKGSPVWSDLWGDVPEREETGIDDFLVVHVPNFRPARAFYGQPDFAGQESMFSCLNARYSQMDFLFANHADPVIKRLPKGIVDPVTGELDKKNLAYIEAGDADEPDPEYMTWDSNAQEMLAFVEEITAKILMMTETDKALLGIDAGSGPASGRALKFSLMATLAKVNRKRAYYDKAIPKMLELSQRLWGEKDPLYVTIQWPDGLPQDTLELLDEIDRRLANGTISKKEAVKRLDNVDDEVAEKTLDDVAEDGDNDADAVARAVQKKERPPIKVDVEAMGEMV